MNCEEFFLGSYIREKYVPYHQSKGLKNITRDLQMVDVILGYDIVQKSLNKVTKNDLITFFRELQIERNIAHSTVNRYYSRFSNIFHYALDEGDITLNPLKGIKKFKEYCRSRCLSEEEISTLLNECKASKNEEIYAIAVLALNTGMRCGEILSLTADNVEVSRKNIVLDGSKTKSGESRTIPLNKAALSIINERLEQSGDGRLFKSRDFSCAFENALKRGEIKQARFHDLRRTFATHLMLDGVPISIISRILGHSNIQTTERYLSYGEEDMLKSVSKINFA
jgi:integrase